MIKILPYIPFFFLCFALYLLISGGWLLLFPEKANEKNNKKKKELTKKDIFWTRVIGAGNIAVALLLLLTFKIDVGWLDKPEVVAWSENQTVSQDYEAMIDSFLDENVIPGMVVAVVDENGSHLFSYGYQGVNAQQKITPDTLFEIGSLSKVFTGLLLAEAVDSGAATLDDPIRSCIPQEFIREQAFYDQITLAHLTTHTSGLPRLPKTLDFTLKSAFAGFTGGNPYANVTREKLFSYLSRTAAPKSIGTDWAYSNYGVGLLGACLSGKKGLSYEETLRSVIAAPLEMKNTTIHLNPAQEALYAPGYRGYLRLGRLMVGIQSQPWLMGEGLVGAGGIRSTGADMLKFLKACISDELDFIPLSKEPIFRMDDESDLGMGWLLDRSMVENQTIIWHNGQTGGFNSYLAFSQDKPYGVFVIANTTINIQSLGEDIVAALGN
ncbi:MAG TPA: serine hydrolase domain-containing protein [Anaerolineae bacterium]|nr:serine hydrolase domain-containing protein [Anaerolineae bacterium]